ncbi:MAG: dTDP-4-dehydrorhamnose 3,5-epimerase, partial [Pseudonocardiales bacterium]|nr:dTDP-4-dehydrorhamnose 3,5-epimerase [Pseudonocardiales bacterium]
LYVCEGLGHGFCALSDDATLCYLVSTAYNPGHEWSVHPLDPDLGIEWPVDGEPVLSARDAAAPSLADAAASDLLPQLNACRDHTATMRARKDS